MFMRFHIGAVPETPDFITDGWKPLREPGPILMQVFALPIGLATSALMVLAWLCLTPVANHPAAPILWMCLGLLFLFPAHELLHAIVHPRQGRTNGTILGFWPSRMIFYAHYLGEISRNRFIAILAAPFLIISVVPLLVCAVLGQASVTVAYISCLNAFCSCADLLGIILFLFQIPQSAIVRNQGWRTYWKPAPAEAQ
jgi:hypothetical protein